MNGKDGLELLVEDCSEALTTDLVKLPGITCREINSFCRNNITTLNSLWERAGKDFDKGIDQIADLTKIDRNRLITLLADRARHEAIATKGWGLKHYLLEGSLIIGMLILIILTLHAAGALHWSFGINKQVLVATHDLKAGRILRSGDMQTARLVSRNNYFYSWDNLEGLVLARDVTRSQPLVFEDLLRLQVVAAKDIPADKPVAEDAVHPIWSSYEPNAALELQNVVGHKPRYAIRNGDVVLAEFIEP